MAKKIKTDGIDTPKANMSSDRARRINSLHKRIDDVTRDQDKATLDVSTEINSLTKEQQRLMKQLNIEHLEFTTETAAAYNGVLKNFGRAIGNFSNGIKNITMDTAKATSGAIAQYGRAIGEDININKKNTVAMSLASISPLIGYLAAKTTETEAFRNLTSKIGSSIRDKFRRNKKPKMNMQDFDEDEIPKMRKGGLVKKGGVVQVHAAEIITPVDKVLEKVKHAKTEDNTHKLNTSLNTMSQSVVRMQQVVEHQEETKKDIVSTFLGELKKLDQEKETKTQTERIVDALEEIKAATIGSADRMSIAWERTLMQHPAIKGMIAFGQTMKSVISTPFKALFSLRGGFASDIKRATSTSNIYQQQINLLALIYTKGMGYLRDIKKFTHVTAETLAGEKVSPTADKQYTLFRKIKDFMTGKEEKEGEGGKKKTLFDSFAESLELDKATLSEAGLQSFSDLLNPKKLLENMGITKESIKEKLSSPEAAKAKEILVGSKEKAAAAAFDAEFAARALAKSTAHKARGAYKDIKGYDYTGTAEDLREKAENAKFDLEVKAKGLRKRLTKRRLRNKWEDIKGYDYKAKAQEMFEGAKSYDYKAKAQESLNNVKSFPGRMVNELSRIRKAEEDREEREGPHSPSMAENIAATATTTKKAFKEDMKNEKQKLGFLDKIKQYGRFQSEKLQWLGNKSKSFSDVIKNFFPILFSFFASLGRSAQRIIRFLKDIALSVGGGLLAGGGRLGKFGKRVGKNIGSRTAARYKTGGLASVARGGLKFGTKLAAGAAAAGTATLVGGWMTMSDMVQAVVSPGEFAGGVLTRAFSAALGGAGEAGKGGIEGLKRGMMKGAALGGAAGMFIPIPGIGPMMGAAIGALAGGILGFIGGERLSKVISGFTGAIGKLLKGIWKVVTFPFKLISMGIKFAWNVLTFPGKLFKEGLKSSWVLMKHLGKKFLSWLGSFFSSEEEGGKGGLLYDVKEGMKIMGEGFRNAIKEAIHWLLTPVRLLSSLFKNAGLWIDENISKIPIIGGIYRAAKATYKGVKGFVTSVHEGTLAENLEKSLQENDKRIMAEKARKEALANETPEQRRIRRQKEILREKAKLIPPGATSVTLREGKIITNKAEFTNAIRQGNNMDIVQANLNMAMLESLEKINKSLTKTREETTAATIISSNNISTTVSNAISKTNNNTGGGSNGSDFSNAENRADAIAAAVMM